MIEGEGAPEKDRAVFRGWGEVRFNKRRLLSCWRLIDWSSYEMEDDLLLSCWRFIDWSSSEMEDDDGSTSLTPESAGLGGWDP